MEIEMVDLIRRRKGRLLYEAKKKTIFEENIIKMKQTYVKILTT